MSAKSWIVLKKYLFSTLFQIAFTRLIASALELCDRPFLSLSFMRTRYGDIEIEDVGTDLSLLSPSSALFMVRMEMEDVGMHNTSVH